MDTLTAKQLDSLHNMKYQSKTASYQLAVAEQIGIHTLRMLHKKPTLIQRIKNKIGG